MNVLPTEKKDTGKVLKLVCTYVYFSEKDQSTHKVLERDCDPRKLENTSLRRCAAVGVAFVKRGGMPLTSQACGDGQ